MIGCKKNGVIVDFDNRGTYTTVNWQVGGSFVYCELAIANQKFVDNIN